MMCLGWNNQQKCTVRGQDVIETCLRENGAFTPSGMVDGAPGSNDCPTPWWFWIGAGVVAIGALVKGAK